MPSKKCLYDFRNRALAGAVLLLVSGPTLADPLTLPTDKAAHFGLSSVAVELSMKSCQAWEGHDEISPACRYGSTGLVLALGVLKEVSDQQRGGRFDQQDLVADVLGVITGNLLQWKF
jgi:uncharacterized protein YfiM (DUF2279 family)